MRFLPVLLLLALPAFAGETAYRALAYHDVRDDVAGDYDPDQYAVSTQSLIDQFTWLRDNGYQPVSIEQLVEAQAGRQVLPERPVLLTFDDGLLSVYTHVFPLLKLFDYPAVVSVVTNWIEMQGSVDYADRQRSAADFLSWDQIRELQASGLVEIASHTHNLHQGIQGNPEGNLQPAAVTRRYFDGAYEDEAAYRNRITADLARSVATLADETGRSPRVITWPYGAYNDQVASIAAGLGMRVSLTLNPKARRRGETLHIRRDLVVANPRLADFSAGLLNGPRPSLVRVAQVNLDRLHDADQATQSANLDRLLDRIKALAISHVFLQSFADVDGDGTADAAYFPNRHLPMRADLFNRVAWQLKTRAEVEVFARLPMLAYEGSAFDPAWQRVDLRVGAIHSTATPAAGLSPFNAKARNTILEIVEDLGRRAQFDGLAFQEDWNSHEYVDVSIAAQKSHRNELGIELTGHTLAIDATEQSRLIAIQARTLVGFSSAIIDNLRRYIPDLVSARDVIPGVSPENGVTPSLAADFDTYLETYDYVSLMAVPAAVPGSDTRRFFENLVAEVRQKDAGLNQTIFELQTIDDSRDRPVPSAQLRTMMRWLQSLGVRHLGYYPDDFVIGYPDLDELRRGISLDEHLMGAVGR